GDEEGGAATAEKRQQPKRLTRGLEGEHDRCEERPRGAGEHGRHPDQRADAQVDAEVRRGGSDSRGQDSSEGSADGEERSERTSRRAASERDAPGDELQDAEG